MPTCFGVVRCAFAVACDSIALGVCGPVASAVGGICGSTVAGLLSSCFMWVWRGLLAWVGARQVLGLYRRVFGLLVLHGGVWPHLCSCGCPGGFGSGLDLLGFGGWMAVLGVLQFLCSFLICGADGPCW